MDAATLIPKLLGFAVILPLVSFFVILRFGPKMGKAGEYAAYLATGAIGSAAVLSFFSLVVWLSSHMPEGAHHGGEHGAGHAAVQSIDSELAQVNPDGTVSVALLAEEPHGEASHEHAQKDPPSYTGEFNFPMLGPWVLGQFGDLRLSISYYIDALTVTMFCMVTFIATLIHIYAMGYMHDELHDITDHEVTMSDGEHLHRPGRYHRFFQYLSLFCFSMLGLVIAGNIAMVFVFWELVGVCSYFLIGFYVERHSASTAANKAFIVNRVGDFGMIIGLLALWSGLGTFSFGDIEYTHNDIQREMPGIFNLVREAQEEHHGSRTMRAPDGMVRLAASDEIAELVQANQQTDKEIGNSKYDVVASVNSTIEHNGSVKTWRQSGMGYWLLIVAGLGIFCGCVGKSAQFPLHVWLPDAMEGPTPVSALVHSATMVAAGVYLVGRFFPVFTPEVLLVIACVGVITLFMAATIAITATDIKRVLAYSTVSQLGYMMMALGVGGWVAGLMHLITHAFFKSLLFMGSGSVIHAVHTNEMPEMGGLRKKMPVTAYTMLVGCLAIAGAGVPFMMGLFGQFPQGLGFSGFYSKDKILEQAYSFMQGNNHALAGVFFLAAAGGAAITAFYMFRMWYLTFAGEPRNQERYDHAHESPPNMYVPLVILAVMAITVAWSPLQGIVGGVIAAVAFFIGRRIYGSKAATGNAHTDHHHDDHSHGDNHGHSALPAWIGDLPWVLGAAVLGIALIWQIVGAMQDGALHNVTLENLLEQARPAGTLATADGVWLKGWHWPNEHIAHEPASVYSIVVPVSLVAIGTAFTGFLLATVMYGLGYLDPAEVRKQFQPVYTFLLNKWWFDELYDLCFIRPTHWISGIVSGMDRNWIDWLIDGSAKVVRGFSVFWAWLADTLIVDGIVDKVASCTHSLGLSLRNVQTGRLRQYVMFIVIGAVAIFVIISFFWNPTLAG